MHRMWCMFLENDCVDCQSSVIRCIISFFPLTGRTGSIHAGMGLARLVSDGSLLRQGQDSTVYECVCCLLLPSSPSVSLCLSSQMCRSINDWCLPIGLIFHLQPASQLFSELGTGPHAWTHGPEQHDISSSEVMWFLECPMADVSPTSVSTWIISPSLFLFCLFLFYILGGDSGVTDQSSCWHRFIFAMRLHLCFRVTVFNSIYAQPFIAIPRSTGIKSHFSAAEAVIPCCQSPLYWRSCICSSLVLSIEWELQEPRQAQLCCLTN